MGRARNPGSMRQDLSAWSPQVRSEQRKEYFGCGELFSAERKERGMVHGAPIASDCYQASGN